MPSPNVESLARAALKKEFPRLFPAEAIARLFVLPEGGYARVAARPDAGPMNSDPVELTHEFEAALFRLYEEFGVPRCTPRTLGELLGGLSYCNVLFEDNSYPRINAKEDAEWLVAADMMLEKYSPELMPAVAAYRAGDKAALEQFGQEFLTPETLSWHYVQAYGGWAGEPYLKEHGIKPPSRPPERNQPRMRLVE